MKYWIPSHTGRGEWPLPSVNSPVSSQGGWLTKSLPTQSCWTVSAVWIRRCVHRLESVNPFPHSEQMNGTLPSVNLLVSQQSGMNEWIPSHTESRWTASPQCELAGVSAGVDELSESLPTLRAGERFLPSVNTAGVSRRLDNWANPSHTESRWMASPQCELAGVSTGRMSWINPFPHSRAGERPLPSVNSLVYSAGRMTEWNLFPHWEQVNGLSPVWTCWCAHKSAWISESFPTLRAGESASPQCALVCPQAGWLSVSLIENRWMASQCEPARVTCRLDNEWIPSHTESRWMASPQCELSGCFHRLDDWLNANPQWVQVNGLSPVWTRSCCCTVWITEWILPHTESRWMASPQCGCADEFLAGMGPWIPSHSPTFPWFLQGASLLDGQSVEASSTHTTRGTVSLLLWMVWYLFRLYNWLKLFSQCTGTLSLECGSVLVLFQSYCWLKYFQIDRPDNQFSF